MYKLLEFGINWLSPQLLNEVIEERSNEGYCGWPACCEEIPKPGDARYV